MHVEVKDLAFQTVAIVTYDVLLSYAGQEMNTSMASRSSLVPLMNQKRVCVQQIVV